MQKYTNIPVPVTLELPPANTTLDRFPGNDPDRKAALIRDDKARCTEWADVFRRGVPTARIVIIPNADHYVYISNAEQVVTEINAFLARLH